MKRGAIQFGAGMGAVCLALNLATLGAMPAAGQTPLGTAFTYQGQLKDAGQPATGQFDLLFGLWDAATGGNQIGSAVCLDNIQVADGLFTVQIDFGAQFNGDRRHLEIAVRPGNVGDCANPSGFTTLSPRQELTAAPYALGLRANSVSSAMIQDGAITSAKLADGSVTDTKLALPIHATSLTPDVNWLFRMDALGTGSPVAGYFRSQNGMGLVASSSGTGGPGLLATCISSSVTLANPSGNPAALVASGHSSSAYLCNSAGYAGDFLGNVRVSGNLSKGGGSFKIDHPLDPTNKYLCHSFVESPDMMNIYNGNIVTDERGYATVVLPEWFEALNRDFRYQLTVIDANDTDAFVQAKVVQKIENNRFTIRTSAPNIEVSWQVTGIRQDPFANANRIPVEVDKGLEERGLYLHPAAWGLPEAAGIGNVSRQHAARHNGHEE